MLWQMTIYDRYWQEYTIRMHRDDSYIACFRWSFCSGTEQSVMVCPCTDLDHWQLSPVASTGMSEQVIEHTGALSLITELQLVQISCWGDRQVSFQSWPKSTVRSSHFDWPTPGALKTLTKLIQAPKLSISTHFSLCSNPIVTIDTALFGSHHDTTGKMHLLNGLDRILSHTTSHHIVIAIAIKTPNTALVPNYHMQTALIQVE